MSRVKARGLRNCNPGNLRISKDKWKGLREAQTDKEFFQFTEMKWGYRALLRTLQNYRFLHFCITIEDFITRWAPPTENDTEAYINFVCGQMGVDRMFAPNVENEQQMCRLAATISYMENGEPAIMNDIRKGWGLLYNTSKR